MNIFDEHYKQKERKLIIYYNTKLLSELLILNYEFSNHEYNGTTGEDVFNILQKKIKFAKEERQQIISDAILILKIKYKKELIDFEKMEFE